MEEKIINIAAKSDEVDYHIVDIFNKAEKTLIKNGFLDENARLNSIKEREDQINFFRQASDNDFYFKMAMIVFYSGFKAITVTNKKDTIEKYFSDIEIASVYTNRDINKILSDKNMIKNNKKIKGCIKNANEMIRIREKFSNFRKYLLSFNSRFPLSEEGIDQIRDDLKKRFSFLGPATVNHFLTDFAFPVLKPDRMVMRVLYRTHLLRNESEADYEKAIEIGKRIAHLLNIPIRYVDTVLVSIGQVGEANICTKSDPKCNICELNKICNFSRNTYASKVASNLRRQFGQ